MGAEHEGSDAARGEAEIDMEQELAVNPIF
jgi:hypothetical protein